MLHWHSIHVVIYEEKVVIAFRDKDSIQKNKKEDDTRNTKSSYPSSKTFIVDQDDKRNNVEASDDNQSSTESEKLKMEIYRFISERVAAKKLEEKNRGFEGFLALCV